METTTIENKFEARKYWISFPSFYADKSMLTMSLIDSDAKVMLKITPVLPGAEGRPVEGQQKYDHKNGSTFALNIFEIQALVTAYRYGYNMNEPTTFLHVNKGTNIICSFGTYNGRFNISIRNLGTQVSHQYFFNSMKLNKDSQTYINHETELFISMLESVLKELVLVCAKTIPAAQVSTTQQSSTYTQQKSPAYTNAPMQQQNNNMQQPMMQQQPQVMAQQPMTQQPMANVQSAMNNNSPLPNSNNMNEGMAPSNFDF